MSAVCKCFCGTTGGFSGVEITLFLPGDAVCGSLQPVPTPYWVLSKPRLNPELLSSLSKPCLCSGRVAEVQKEQRGRLGESRRDPALRSLRCLPGLLAGTHISVRSRIGSSPSPRPLRRPLLARSRSFLPAAGRARLSRRPRGLRRRSARQLPACALLAFGFAETVPSNHT